MFSYTTITYEMTISLQFSYHDLSKKKKSNSIKHIYSQLLYKANIMKYLQSAIIKTKSIFYIFNHNSVADPIYLFHWSKKLFKTNFAFFFYIQQKSPFENFTNSRIKIIFFLYYIKDTTYFKKQYILVFGVQCYFRRVFSINQAY